MPAGPQVRGPSAGGLRRRCILYGLWPRPGAAGAMLFVFCVTHRLVSRLPRPRHQVPLVTSAAGRRVHFELMCAAKRNAHVAP